MTARANEERALQRLWSLHENVVVESDDDGVVLLSAWGETDLGDRGLPFEAHLRRMTLGPVALDNMDHEGRRDDLEDLLAEVSGLVVHTLGSAGRGRSGVSVVPIAARAGFAPRPADPFDVVRLSRVATIRPVAGTLVVGVPAARHEVVCEGVGFGGLLARLATSRQVSDLSGRAPSEDFESAAVLAGATHSDVEDILGWMVAAGVVVVRRPDGTYAEDTDPDMRGWSAHELEFDARTRRPGPDVEVRSWSRDAWPQAAGSRGPAAGAPVRLPRPAAPDWWDALLATPAGGAGTDDRLRTDDLAATLGRALEACVALAGERPGGPPGAAVREDELRLYVAVERGEVAPGVYRYGVADHVLEPLELPADTVADAVEACAAAAGARRRPAAVLLIMSRHGSLRADLGPAAHATRLTQAGALQQLLQLTGRSCGVTAVPVPLNASEGWTTLLDQVWPGETPVGVCRVETRPSE